MITPSSLAAIKGVSVKNQQFAVSTQVLPQKNVIIGTFDETTFVDLAPNVPFQVFSPEDAGSKTGFGYMLHRLVKASMKQGKVETWVIPQLEGGSTPAFATGAIDFTASVNVRAGVVAFYAAGERVSIQTSLDDSADDIGDALADAINNNNDMPIVATNLAGVVAVDAKSSGDWGNDISLTFNLNVGEELPTGVAVTVTDMGGGAGVPDIQDALDALGSGDGQNDKFFTNLIHGYGADTATLDAISQYNGEGNEYVGNYAKEVARPFRSLTGNVEVGTSALSALIAFSDTRLLDRTNGIIAVPGSPNHPQEIAAQLMGLMAVVGSTRPEESYIDKRLDGVYAGAVDDRWTNDYDERDLAVKSGISPAHVRNNIVYAQNVITFYRPENIAPSSNGFRSMRNIAINQNMLYNYRLNFEREKWIGITIVEDVAAVSNAISREKARDVDAVIDDLLELADLFAGNAWLYNSSFTKSEIQKGDKVVLRDGLTGFDITFPVILSGEGGILNSDILFDTSIAILSAGGE